MAERKITDVDKSQQEAKEKSILGECCEGAVKGQVPKKTAVVELLVDLLQFDKSQSGLHSKLFYRISLVGPN